MVLKERGQCGVTGLTAMLPSKPKIFHVSVPRRRLALSRPLSNERVEPPATGSPAVPELPLAQSSALELESQRLSTQTFIRAHKAACLKSRDSPPQRSWPQKANARHADPTHSHIREADLIPCEKDLDACPGEKTSFQKG
ncbi:hypothetical protein CHARACLAT_009043 [Characodon lateralis]|uniref:Uncharacterized protein n=1 Tax=Characodon lateralis TaxID=208331 RepID=A0ABU7EI37_9TELE|nr:hypothetical protein [Characodon lateralis]